jgi:hypothetical protein
VSKRFTPQAQHDDHAAELIRDGNARLTEQEWIETLYGKRPTSSDAHAEYDRRVADFRDGRAFGVRHAGAPW